MGLLKVVTAVRGRGTVALVGWAMDPETPSGHNTILNKPNILMVSHLRNAVPEACCSFLHSSGHQVHSILPSKHLSSSHSNCHN